MNITLTPLEARVIACLLEKEITTPEAYPLSLNALVNACNQKSNREPVLSLNESDVQATVDALIKRYLVSAQTGYGNRVSKYQHRFCNSEYGTLKFSPRELGVICELLLRGPQTPGELRTHASRLCPLSDVSEVEEVLLALSERSDGPFVVRLGRQPGRRESRYAQLFCDADAHLAGADQGDAVTMDGVTAPENSRSMTAIEQEIADLKRRVTRLEELLLATPAEDPRPI